MLRTFTFWISGGRGIIFPRVQIYVGILKGLVACDCLGSLDRSMAGGQRPSTRKVTSPRQHRTRKIEVGGRCASQNIDIKNSHLQTSRGNSQYHNLCCMVPFSFFAFLLIYPFTSQHCPIPYFAPFFTQRFGEQVSIILHSHVRTADAFSFLSPVSILGGCCLCCLALNRQVSSSLLHPAFCIMYGSYSRCSKNGVVGSWEEVSVSSVVDLYFRYLQMKLLLPALHCTARHRSVLRYTGCFLARWRTLASP